MNLKLGSAGSVTVAGSQADNGYTGDDHVVGPDASGNHVNSLTLGNTEGATTDGAPYTIGADRPVHHQPARDHQLNRHEIHRADHRQP